MTHHEHQDDWLDALLQPPHVDDDGFVDVAAARAVAASPRRPPQRRQRALVLLASALASATVSTAVVAHALTAAQASQAFSFSQRVMFCLAALIAVGAALSGEALRINAAAPFPTLSQEGEGRPSQR